MTKPFRVAAVLGAGTMGAQIAAHFANAGLEVRLLDVTQEIADQGIKRLRALKPDPCFVPDVIKQIRTGGFDTDAGLLTDADWIVEAVVESLDIKQTLLSRLAKHVSADAVLSTNTSGIPNQILMVILFQMQTVFLQSRNQSCFLRPKQAHS